MKAVDSFKAGRSALLGFAIFAFNPVDASCAILAALDLATADVVWPTVVAAGIVFAIVGILPVAVPVLFVLVRGANAAGTLKSVRVWIGSHTNVMNGALILVIGVLQLQKGISASSRERRPDRGSRQVIEVDRES